MVFRSRIYVDNRLHHMLSLSINQPFWDRGDFPQVINNGSEYIALNNPWVNGTRAAPFDQRMLSPLTTANERGANVRLGQPSI